MEKRKIKIKIPTGFRIFAILKSIISQFIELFLSLNDEIEDLKSKLKKLTGKGTNPRKDGDK